MRTLANGFVVIVDKADKRDGDRYRTVLAVAEDYNQYAVWTEPNDAIKTPEKMLTFDGEYFQAWMQSRDSAFKQALEAYDLR